MVSSKALRRIATNPSDYARFMTTGQVPKGKRPSGPLVDLLRSIMPRDLANLRGVTISCELGYNGSRIFANGLQALRWIAPSEEVFDGFPADSWRIKNFHRILTVDDLVDACASVPEGFVERYPRLRRVPSAVRTTAKQAAVADDAVERSESALERTGLTLKDEHQEQDPERWVPPSDDRAR